jgi:probable DNA metabolism protein
MVRGPSFPFFDEDAMECYYDGTLEALFALLDRVCRGEETPSRVAPQRYPADSGCAPLRNGPQGELFDGETGGERRLVRFNAAGRDRGLIALWEGERRDIPAAAELFAVSADAYYRFVQGWMSGLPLEAELIRFARGVILAARRALAAQRAPSAAADAGLAARAAAEGVCRDLTDPAASRIHAVSLRVGREIHRLMGLIRFRPLGAEEGPLAARCSPDSFILPALADHFFLRQGCSRGGGVPWLIIDEGRRIALACDGRAPPLLASLSALPETAPKTPEGGINAGEAPSWEALWRLYHRAVNNPARHNPRLQRQFMPLRYWKYLPECDG